MQMNWCVQKREGRGWTASAHTSSSAYGSVPSTHPSISIRKHTHLNPHSSSCGAHAAEGKGPSVSHRFNFDGWLDNLYLVRNNIKLLLKLLESLTITRF